ncbi:MAG: hypothetical protein H8E12_18635 [Rhodobacteraceae bacterium]|nr:hypothetical protein [Paracoccaceae bacterium]
MSHPQIQVREYLNSDLDHFVENLRQADRDEIKAYEGMGIREGLKLCIKGNDELWVITFDNIPAMVYGLKDATIDLNNDKNTRSGLIWALGTDDVFKYPKSLIKLSKKIINNWFLSYDFLFNYVWEGNTKHMKWIERMGFTIFKDSGFTSDMGEKFLFFVQYYPQLGEEE